jgi:glycosyltransferase involved in cell wall biosynthesis
LSERIKFYINHISIKIMLISKIAIVTRNMNIGGVGINNLGLSKWLKQQGHDVTIITTSDRGRLFKEIKKCGITALHVYGKNTSHPLLHAYRAAKVIRKAGYDYVLLTNCERFVQAAIHMLPTSIKVIPWIRNDEKDHYRKASINSSAWNVAIAVSPKVAKTAQNKFKRPVVYIPNGIQPPQDFNIIRRSDINEPIQLLYVGRMDNRSKGIFLLPEIIKEIGKKDIEFVLRLIGDGPDFHEILGRLRYYIDNKKVEILGSVTIDKVYKEYLRSHVVIMPSYFEGLPTVPIEAQWSGCVPIASRLKGITDIVIKDGKTGLLVPKGDIKAFAEATILLAQNRKLWRKFSLSGQNYVRKNFSIEKMGRCFEKLFTRINENEFPAKFRTALIPVNPFAFTWREHIPKSVHRLGFGSKIRQLIGYSR